MEHPDCISNLDNSGEEEEEEDAEDSEEEDDSEDSGEKEKEKETSRVSDVNSLSEFPQVREHHPLHPDHILVIKNSISPEDFCNACGESVFDDVKAKFIYKCSERTCPFLLDYKCSLLTLTKTHPNDQPPNHLHPLILCDKGDHPNKDDYFKEGFSYDCTCCCLPIDGRSVNVCLECQGFLHGSCAQEYSPSSSIIEHHPFHPKHTLTLLPWAPFSFRRLICRGAPFSFRRFICDGCGQKRKGFAYHCAKCEFYLDVHCASLKEPLHGEEIQVHCHRDRFRRLKLKQYICLIACEISKKDFPHPCFVCRLPLVVDSVIFFSPDCGILLHKSCADLPREINQHPLHPQHALKLQELCVKHSKCSACLHVLDYLVYECCCCDFSLDVKCALSKPTTMMSQVHHHPLVLADLFDKVVCDVCDEPCLTPFFHCLKGDLQIHVHCIKPLPETIKYRRHRHHLKFSDSPIKDYPDEDDDAEFYCQACEQRRELKQLSYYCTQCTYVAHPYCVVHEIIRVLEEEYRSRNESQEDVNTVKNVPVMEEEMSPEKSNEDANEVEGPISMTFAEFGDSLNEAEIKEIRGVFKAANEDNQGYTTFNMNACLHLDTKAIQVMKKLVPIYPLSDIKYEDILSRLSRLCGSEDLRESKVIKMDNNMMSLEKSVPILKALIRKYRDFGCASTLSPKARASFILIVCEAVSSMCSTNVADIRAPHLFVWFYCFLLGKYAGLEMQFAFNCLARVVKAHFGLHASLFADPNFDGENLDELTEKHALAFNKELSIACKDGETNDNNYWKVHFMESNKKLYAEIKELKKQAEENEKKTRKIQETLKAKLSLRRLKKECFTDAQQLKGRKAGSSII